MQAFNQKNSLRRRLLQWIGGLGLAGGLGPGWTQVGSGGTGAAADEATTSADPDNIGTAPFVAGQVKLTRNGHLSSAQAGMGLQQGDLIEAEHGAELHARFNDGAYLVVRQDSAVRLDQYVAQGDPSDTAIIHLLRGALRSVTGWIGKIGTPDTYQIVTSTATIGVRGTDHEVVIVTDAQAQGNIAAGTHDKVNDGATFLRNENGSVEIAQGASGFAGAGGRTPRLHATVPAFFNRLRSANEDRVRQYKQVQRRFMERQLRQRGKLAPGQHFGQFVQQHRRARAGTAPGKMAAQQARQAQRTMRSLRKPRGAAAGQRREDNRRRP